MTIKTPQEIAAEQMAAFTVDNGDVQECSVGYIHEQIAEAIEADRKQRAADLATLADAAAYWVSELNDHVIPASRESGDDDSADSQELERDELQAALGRYLNAQENDPNPILLEFRDEGDDPREWLENYNENAEFRDELHADFEHRYIEHARKVLALLAAL